MILQADGTPILNKLMTEHKETKITSGKKIAPDF